MAIERLSAKVGKKGGAGGHARYITRQGPYAKPEGDDERLYVGHGNLPVWSWDDPVGFFDASDLFERSNGSTYKEWEIALPRELSDDQLRALINEFIEEQIGDRFAYLYAIHIPKATDGGEQPHCHLMFSERELDGIERSREQFFKRANSKHPERGGCKKANTGLKASQRKELLMEVRQAWETTCNRHLAAAGFDVRIDMRSYADRGIDKIPEPKLRLGEAQGRGRAEVIDYFEAKRELQAACAEVERLIPDMGAEIISLREAREAAAAAQQQQLERGPVLMNATSGEPYRAPSTDQLAEWQRELDSRPEPTDDDLAELMPEGVTEALEELQESAPGEDEIDLDDFDALNDGPNGPNFG